MYGTNVIIGIINFKTQRKMKKIVLVLTLALIGTYVMNAQPPRRSDMTPEQMVEMRVERMDKMLGLTADQKAQITRIYTEEMKTMHKEKPVRMDKDEKPDEAAMQAHREQMKARRDATNAKIEALLTPEQSAKFAEMKKHEGKRGPRHGHDKGRRGPGDGAKRGHDRGCKDCTCKDK